MKTEQSMDDLIAELGLGELVGQICARPVSEATSLIVNGQVLHHNSLYGVELLQGSSVYDWLSHSVSPAPTSVLFLTSLPDFVVSSDQAVTVLFAIDWPAMTAILNQTAGLFDLVCIGPVQALCGPETGRVSEVIESLQSFWLPTYASHKKLPPLLLFNGADSLERQDVQLMRQYIRMLC